MLVDKHISPRIGSTPLQKLNAPQLNAMYADMLKSGRRNGKGGLSVRTVRYAHTVVRKALSDAVGWNLITRNVADAAQPPEKQKTTKETWGAEQLRTFLTQVREDRLFAAWQLAALTGMRRGEVLGLSWADIDLDASRLAVRRSLISSDYEIKVSEPKTEKGRRVVALDPAMVAALRDHQGRQLLERAAMGGDWDNALDLVFTREDGSPIHPQAFSEMFEKHVKDSKLPKLSLHGLRHTHATIALRAGVHPKVVSERLGHASVAFTLDVYTDSLPDMQETAASLIAALVLEP
jgi:integrase